jgi:hypothetical protein
MRKVLTLLAVVAVSSSVASAEIMLHKDVTVIEGGAYTVLTLTAVEEGGLNVASFDGSFTEGTEVMSQVKYLDVLDTPTLKYGGELANPQLDTHFLFHVDDDLLSETVPNEQDDGTFIGGSFGIKPGAQATSLPFIQLVIPGNYPNLKMEKDATEGLLLYDFGIGYGEAGGVVMKSLFSGAIVPEPATMTLLAIGGLGALIRRKRR